jgi:two-component system phosphate regulon response regulator OmpR
VADNVLIVDDDLRLCKLLDEYLTTNGMVVSTLDSGIGVIPTIETQSPDIIILDVMMPEKDGLEVLRDIRRAHSTPVIMLTAKGEDTDRIVGLELGADDYLAKPFNPRELLARIKAVLRRSNNEKSGKGAASSSEGLIEAGGLTLNRFTQTVVAAGITHELSTTEFKLLEVLMRHPNTVLSRDQLMTLVRGRDFMAFDRSIDVHISKLRNKLESDPKSPKLIKTIWGTGYMFVDQP